MPESTLAAEFVAQGHAINDDVPRNVITDYLGRKLEPKKPCVRSVGLDGSSRFAFLSGEALATLDDAQLLASLVPSWT